MCYNKNSRGFSGEAVCRKDDAMRQNALISLVLLPAVVAFCTVFTLLILGGRFEGWVHRIWGPRDPDSL